MTMRASAYGRLGHDLKAITTASGKPMAAARIALDLCTQRDPEATHKLSPLAFGQQAGARLRRAQGDMMAVSGRLQRNVWTDKEGVQPVDLQLIVDQVMSGTDRAPWGP